MFRRPKRHRTFNTIELSRASKSPHSGVDQAKTPPARPRYSLHEIQP